MDNNYTIRDRIELVAAHLRLIADLLLAAADPKEVNLAAFALVMEDLAARLERAAEETAPSLLSETGTDRERQP
ncbi:MAG TPA: hypothetical protein VGE50_06655 [Gammaproteobacteria bacterium]